MFTTNVLTVDVFVLLKVSYKYLLELNYAVKGDSGSHLQEEYRALDLWCLASEPCLNWSGNNKLFTEHQAQGQKLAQSLRQREVKVLFLCLGGPLALTLTLGY